MSKAGRFTQKNQQITATIYAQRKKKNLCKCNNLQGFFYALLFRVLHVVGCFTLSGASRCRVQICHKPHPETINKAETDPHPPYFDARILYLTPSTNFFHTQ